MNAKLSLAFFALLTAATGAPAAPQHRPLDQHTMPDSLEMNDGRTLRGLILKNTAKSVLFQTSDGELLLPKTEIRRIHDEIDGEIVFADMTAKGRLPSWRAMVADLRNHDDIKSLEQIPATTVVSGLLKNIPYLSFRVNKQSEFNVYGDPNDPVAIEFGMYGKRRRSPKYRQIVREFLAGHLHSREEINALYTLNLHGDERRVGYRAFKIIPPDHPESHGGWWIVLYDPKRIDQARVSDGRYASLTLPFEQVNNPDGSLRQGTRDSYDKWLADTMQSLTGRVPQIRGFYRDKDGVFRLINFEDPS